MTQENKDLLLKDLCARLPYGVKFVIDNGLYNVRTLSGIDETVPFAGWQMCVFARGMSAIPVDDIKPYLFPLSSMTEEQKNEYKQYLQDIDGYVYSIDCVPQIDWLNKNHFDYRGLISKGLALDATGLNIY